MLRQITHSSTPQTAHQTLSKETLRLKPGDIFRGTIIRKSPAGEVLVAARGREFLAHSELNLVEGQNHDFQVKTSGPRIEIKVLDRGNLAPHSPLQTWASNSASRDKLASILRELSGALALKHLPPDTRLAFKSLSQLLPLVLYHEPQSDDARRLSRFVLGSGLFWENRVVRYLLGQKSKPWKTLLAKDLKGLLLSLDRNLNMEGDDHGDLESLAVKVKQALHLIEQEQILNLSSMEKELGWFWFIPGLEERGMRKAEVFLNRNDRGKGIHCFMRIEFTHLGKMEVEVSLRETLIGIKIHLEDRQKADLVKENLSLLKAKLQEAGLVPGTILCEVKEMGELDLTPFLGDQSQSPPFHLVI